MSPSSSDIGRYAYPRSSSGARGSITRVGLSTSSGSSSSNVGSSLLNGDPSQSSDLGCSLFGRSGRVDSGVVCLVGVPLRLLGHELGICAFPFRQVALELLRAGLNGLRQLQEGVLKD